MTKLFYVGLAALCLFEVLNVYFIMPMPGSQEHETIAFAYFLYTSRWWIRGVLLAMALLGFRAAFSGRHKWVPALMILLTTGIGYAFNFKMTADHMFLQPAEVNFATKAENQIPPSRLVLGVEQEGQAKAYPIEYLTYHHQVQDTIGGKPVIVTYCSVCRTGRVFEPLVDGHPETFRLVGMDHYNAMFEDATTRSWWRQVTGEAITGKRKGQQLPEVPSQQMSIEKWYTLYPDGLVMQPDPVSLSIYDSLANFEQGKNKGRLTRTDTISWSDKSWIIGIEAGSISKAYDWNMLRENKIIHDTIRQIPVVIVLSSDGKSFAAFKRAPQQFFTLSPEDIMRSDSTEYDFTGRDLTSGKYPLERIQASQEFWHSWKYFHPGTLR